MVSSEVEQKPDNSAEARQSLCPTYRLQDDHPQWLDDNDGASYHRLVEATTAATSRHSASREALHAVYWLKRVCGSGDLLP
jgi:hypothetical protein